MALRKLTTQEKVKMLGYKPFIDFMELDAMEEAKKLAENIATEAKLKQLAASIIVNGGISNKEGFVKTWLVYYNNNIEVVEDVEDGMQLRQTIDNLLAGGLKATTISVLTKQAEPVVITDLRAYAAKTAAYTLLASDYSIEVTAGTHTQTLPTAVGVAGKQYVITNSGTGVVTVATTSAQTFVNITGTPTTLSLAQFKFVMVQSNGTNWIVISQN